jgi:hypothetical protein
MTTTVKLVQFRVLSRVFVMQSISSFRFSLRWVFVAVAFAAVSAAALTDGAARWSALLALTSVFALLASILGVIHRRGESRSFWIGFAVFGWAYLVLSQEAIGLSEALPMNVLFTDLYPYFRRTALIDPAGPQPAWVQGVERENGQVVAVIVTQYDFHRLGHSVCTILFALLGGMLGRWFHATRPEEADREYQ